MSPSFEITDELLELVGYSNKDELSNKILDLFLKNVEMNNEHLRKFYNNIEITMSFDVDTTENYNKEISEELLETV